MALYVLRLVRIVLATFFVAGASHAAETTFEIGSGDTIVISVYNEPDLSIRVKVGTSGIIRMPLIGDFMVIGKTPKLVSDELEAAYLDGYLVNPIVIVNIEKFRPFYIRGAVKSAGAYEYSVGMTLEKAIAIAGGLRDRASKSKWFVIRGEDKRRTQVNKDFELMPGDIIEIEEGLF